LGGVHVDVSGYISSADLGLCDACNSILGSWWRSVGGIALSRQMVMTVVMWRIGCEVSCFEGGRLVLALG